MTSICTIGHSNMDAVDFVGRLQAHQTDAVVDVRSTPASSWATQFNRETLRDTLRSAGIRYAFMGKQLGARSTNPEHYRDGQVVYDRIAASEEFRNAIAQVLRNALQLRLTLMCAEQDPLDCHRSVLIARALAAQGCGVEHILNDGTTSSQEELERRLLTQTKQDQPNLFLSRGERVEQAWNQREAMIAYRLPESAGSGQRLVAH